MTQGQKRDLRSTKVKDIVENALRDVLPDYKSMEKESVEAAIVKDLSVYAGDCWKDGKPEEVFAEAYRVWQEGGESKLAAIIGQKIDSLLRGLG